MLDLIPGSNNCPIDGCTRSFSDFLNYLWHLRVDHGPEYFPWTCAIWYNGKHRNAPCFLTEEGFIRHWRENHAEVTTAEEIVHPVYGSHFSFLHAQVLPAEDHDPDVKDEDRK